MVRPQNVFLFFVDVVFIGNFPLVTAASGKCLYNFIHLSNIPIPAVIG